MGVLEKVDAGYKAGYKEVVKLLEKDLSEGVCEAVVNYIREYTPDRGAEVNQISFIDYVADNLYKGVNMSIFARGHKCIGDGDGVLFERLRMLKNELQRAIQGQAASTPQIDCIMTDEEISKWFDRWSVGRFGEDCLNPTRYYNTTEDGRYLYGVKEGATNEEKAIRERVLELLCKIISINKKLNGEGLTKHLTYNEREALKKDRDKLYIEFINLTQPQPEAQITTYEPQQKDLHYYCKKAIEKGYLVKVDGGYRRVSWSKAQLAFFLGHFLKPKGIFPDNEYCLMFGENRLGKALGQLINNKTGNGKPKGYEVVDTLLKE